MYGQHWNTFSRKLPLYHVDVMWVFLVNNLRLFMPLQLLLQSHIFNHVRVTYYVFRSTYYFLHNQNNYTVRRFFRLFRTTHAILKHDFVHVLSRPLACY